MIDFLFNLIEPPRASTWLSRRFFYWKKKKHERLIRAFKMNFDGRYFDVPGAGLIAISEDCHRTTEKVAGFSFGVEWGKYGFCGGVLGRDEAKKLAEFILEKCSEVTETMEEEVNRRRKIAYSMNEEIDFSLCDAIISCLAEHGDMEYSGLSKCLAIKGFIVEPDEN